MSIKISIQTRFGPFWFTPDEIDVRLAIDDRGTFGLDYDLIILALLEAGF